MCMDLYNVQKLLQAKVLTGSELMHRPGGFRAGIPGTDREPGLRQ